MKRTLAPVLALALLAGAFMGLKGRIDRIPRRKIPGSGINYIPSGKYLKMATFGYSSVLADVIYIWAIQYYGNTDIEDRYSHLTHVFSIISELDPGYVDPYVIGALIAVEDTHDIPLALKILDMGLAKNPGQWIFPLEAGHYAQVYMKDYALAKEYYRAGSRQAALRRHGVQGQRPPDGLGDLARGFSDGGRCADPEDRLEPSLRGQGGPGLRHRQGRPGALSRDVRPESGLARRARSGGPPRAGPEGLRRKGLSL
jgi:hypothetical protein